MTQKSKIIQIPDTATIVQMQSVLDIATAGGWVLVSIFTLAGKTYAVFIKRFAE
jgi:hypothetical protein